MGALDQLEKQLDEWLGDKAPVKLPPNGRKGLAGALWWIALVIGILQLWAVWALWHLGHVVNTFVSYSNYLSTTYGYGVTTQHLGFFYWLSLIVLAVDAVILLVAAPSLKQMSKAGWNLLFYSAILNAIVGLLRLFTDYGGVGNFIWAVISSVIGAWLLFQVRGQFTGRASAIHASAPHHTEHHEHVDHVDANKK
jgi:hypothetical protein